MVVGEIITDSSQPISDRTMMPTFTNITERPGIQNLYENRSNMQNTET